MPDTPDNQAQWPQPKQAKPGCSFPVMRIVGLFSLATGVLIDLAHGPLAVHERTLLRRLWHRLSPGDVLLTDRGFGSYVEFHLLGRKGVDCVMRRSGRRKPGEVVKRLGPRDRIVRWKKAAVRPEWLEPGAWEAVPETLLVREVTVHVEEPGLRTRTIEVVTTILDPGQYPAHEIAALYRRRWRVELHLRDIKTTMGMDVLSCRTPSMVEKELWMYVIAYNLIRAVMAQAALTGQGDRERISFKGAVSTLRQWAPVLAGPGLDGRRRLDLYEAMIYYISRDVVPLRPDRLEPRARKRRPKNYQLLNRPRAGFREIQHRSKYTKA